MVEKNYQLNRFVKQDHRLKKNSQFNFIYRKGEKFSSKNFALYKIKSKYKNYKLGLAVSKKVGKAWARNKLKRRMREIVRINQLPSCGFNYVLQAKPGACEIDYKEIEKQLISIFEKGKRVEN